MSELTFNQVPAAISELLERVTRIEELLEKEKANTKEVAEWMDIKEAAVFLKFTVSTIYSKVCRGELPFHKPGKNLRFKRSDLDDYLWSSRRKCAAEIFQEVQALPSRLRASSRTF